MVLPQRWVQFSAKSAGRLRSYGRRRRRLGGGEGELIYFIAWADAEKAFATVPFSTQFLQEVLAKS
jgi:hypothetical protein